MSFIVHWLIPAGLCLYLPACLLLDCEHVSMETKQTDDMPCEIKDNIRGRRIFLCVLALLAIVWILVPLKK
jgi:hypothetical protein